MPPTTDPADPTTLLLFDLDGTITDSYEGIAGSFRHALREVGAPEPRSEVLAGVAGPPMLDTLHAIGLDPGSAARAMTAYRDRYSTIGWRENAVYADMAELIGDLRAAGRRLAIATSKNQVTARRILEHFALAHHFDVIAGAGDDGQRRHKSDVIDFALTELGITERPAGRLAGPDARADLPATTGVVMIGDRSHDVAGAAAFGIPVVFVDWGYAVEPDDESDGARWRVRSPTELRKVLGV